MGTTKCLTGSGCSIDFYAGRLLSGVASQRAFPAPWLRRTNPFLAQNHHVPALYFPHISMPVVSIWWVIGTIQIFLGKRKKDVVMAKKQTKPKISRSKALQWKQWSALVLLLLLLLSMILVLTRL